MSLPNTRFGAKGISRLLTGKKRLWFIGIGGVHMSAMALFAASRGFAVAGSDRSCGESVLRLRAAGIPVFSEQDAGRLVQYDAVVYTLALDALDPEYLAARRLGLPTFSRADFLSYLLDGFLMRIAVGGSHGKSTVTAMLASVFAAAGRDPAVFCGAPMNGGYAALPKGKGQTAIFEACEYQRSFLCFSPTWAVLLNAEWDHVDCYPTHGSILAAFAAFADLPGEHGVTFYNAEDVFACDCVAKSRARCIDFGVENGSYRADGLWFENGFARFRPCFPDGTKGGDIALRIPGRHNVSNAMAAVAVANEAGIPSEVIAAALSGFQGAARRMTYRGLLCGACVYDDYAHHPSEIAATLHTAREMLGGGRLFVVFQAHTYSRTAAFLTEICEALRAADRVFVAPIYAARERDTLGMCDAVIARGIGEKAVAPGSIAAIAVALRAELAPGDLALVMGAGDIDRIFGEFSGKGFTI